MAAIPWILISIVIILILFGILFIIASKNQKKKAPPDYYAFFIIGLMWLAIGIISTFGNDNDLFFNNIFFIMGLAFALIGWAHRKEWKANRKNWMDLGKEERRIMAIIMIVLLISALAGLVVFFLFEKGII